jgi:hypothetical protein
MQMKFAFAPGSFVSLQKKKMERFERVQTTHARSIRGGHL